MRAGLAAEFGDERRLGDAVDALARLGYRELDAFTPFPVEGLDERLNLGRSRLPLLIFPFGLGAAGFAFLVQLYCNAWSYPIDVGGRALFAWPPFIVISFETGVLASAVFGVVALLWLLGLPATTHPLLDVQGFERASIDRFWLAVSARDPRFDAARTATDLRAAGARRVEPFGGAP